MVEATRAGAERITYAELLAERRLAAQEERWHKKECPRCGDKRTIVYQRCELGWVLAKRLHAANYQLERWKDAKNENQGTLW